MTARQAHHERRTGDARWSRPLVNTSAVAGRLDVQRAVGVTGHECHAVDEDDAMALGHHEQRRSPPWRTVGSVQPAMSRSAVPSSIVALLRWRNDSTDRWRCWSNRAVTMPRVSPSSEPRAGAAHRTRRAASAERDGVHGELVGGVLAAPGLGALVGDDVGDRRRLLRTRLGRLPRICRIRYTGTRSTTGRVIAASLGSVVRSSVVFPATGRPTHPACVAPARARHPESEPADPFAEQHHAEDDEQHHHRPWGRWPAATSSSRRAPATPSPRP